MINRESITLFKLLILLVLSDSANGYAFGTNSVLLRQKQQSKNKHSSTAINLSSSSSTSSRRDVVKSLLTSIGIGSTTIMYTTTIVPEQAIADIDFSTIQDLLGSESNQVTQSYSGGKRPTYLVEPTEEFKRNEQKAAEFKRKNILIKKQFIEAIDKITTDPNDYTILATDIDAVRKLVKLNGGLPEGISKDEIVKICRRRKSKKFWSTDVEIAYVFLLFFEILVCDLYNAETFFTNAFFSLTGTKIY
jgi:hypothetical protein